MLIKKMPRYKSCKGYKIDWTLENSNKTSFISQISSHTSHIQRVNILDTVGAHICSPQDFIRNTLARILTADDDDCDDLVDVGDNSVHY